MEDNLVLSLFVLSTSFASNFLFFALSARLTKEKFLHMTASYIMRVIRGQFLHSDNQYSCRLPVKLWPPFFLFSFVWAPMSMVEGRDESENHEIDQNYRTTFVCCSSLEWFNYWRFSSNAWPPSLNLKAHFYLILHFLKLLICCIVNEIVLRKCLQCVFAPISRDPKEG